MQRTAPHDPLQHCLARGAHAGCDGAKCKSKVDVAVDTLGNLLALHGTTADVDDREAVARLAAYTQDAKGEAASLTFVYQDYTGETAAEAAVEAIEALRMAMSTNFGPLVLTNLGPPSVDGLLIRV